MPGSYLALLVSAGVKQQLTFNSMEVIYKKLLTELTKVILLAELAAPSASYLVRPHYKETRSHRRGFIVYVIRSTSLTIR